MGSPQPPDFSSFIAALARELQARKLPFMLIGGQAVLLHGAPRLTEDVDVTLGVGPDQLASIQDASKALALTPLAENPKAFAHDTYVYPVRHEATRLRVDFIFSDTPYEHGAIARAIHVPLEEVEVPFATAEDLIIHKLFAGRARDIEDAESVVRRQGNRLDWPYIEHWAREFAAVPGREDLPEQVARLRTTDRSGG